MTTTGTMIGREIFARKSEVGIKSGVGTTTAINSMVIEQPIDEFSN